MSKQPGHGHSFYYEILKGPRLVQLDVSDLPAQKTSFEFNFAAWLIDLGMTQPEEPARPSPRGGATQPGRVRGQLPAQHSPQVLPGAPVVPTSLSCPRAPCARVAELTSRAVPGLGTGSELCHPNTGTDGVNCNSALVVRATPGA